MFSECVFRPALGILSEVVRSKPIRLPKERAELESRISREIEERSLVDMCLPMTLPEMRRSL